MIRQNGYTEESYEARRDNASEEVGIPDMELPDELVGKKMLRGVLADAMDSLLPGERELAMKVFREGIAAHALAEHKLKKCLKRRSKRPASDCFRWQAFSQKHRRAV